MLKGSIFATTTRIDPYLDEIFNAYAEDRAFASLLASLRVIARVRGISSLAGATGLTRQGIQHALSSILQSAQTICRLATRYDTLANRSNAFLHLACTYILLL